MKRRLVLKMSILHGSLWGSLLAGLPIPAPAAKSAAHPRSVKARALQGVFGTANAVSSDAIKIVAPKLTGGDCVDVQVRFSLDRVEAAAIVLPHSAQPICALARFSYPASAFMTRIKISKTSVLEAYVLAGGVLFRATTKVWFSRGGYGQRPDK